MNRTAFPSPCGPASVEQDLESGADCVSLGLFFRCEELQPCAISLVSKSRFLVSARFFEGACEARALKPRDCRVLRVIWEDRHVARIKRVSRLPSVPLKKVPGRPDRHGEGGRGLRRDRADALPGRGPGILDFPRERPPKGSAVTFRVQAPSRATRSGQKSACRKPAEGGRSASTLAHARPSQRVPKRDSLASMRFNSRSRANPAITRLERTGLAGSFEESCRNQL
jgi:hypothetical protein